MKFDLTLYWSRKPGKFLNGKGQTVGESEFLGHVQEWYSTLVESIRDVFAHLPEGDEKVVWASPEVCTILEFSDEFRAVLEEDAKGKPSIIQHKDLPETLHVMQLGTLNDIDVYCDPWCVSSSLYAQTFPNENKGRVVIKDL